MKNINKEKLYELIIGNIWKLIAFIVFGVVAGYLFDKNATDSDYNYMIISIVTFTLIGIITFLWNIIKGLKK